MESGIDLEAVKQVQQRIWAEGDFSMIAATQQIVAEKLCEAVDLRPGSRVLDVACGSGNVAIAAARRFTRVTGLDYVPALLERGRERAEAERLEVEFVEGDAEELPFEDGSFDFVLSTFGAMFAPDQPRAAGELLRVCRRGGRIGMANWTPDGFVGQMFATVSAHAPPPPGVVPPPLWGTEERLRELFGHRIGSLRTDSREATFRFPSPVAWLEFFRTWFGPTKIAFERVGADGAALEADLLAIVERFNRGGETMIAPAEYLEVVAERA